MALTKSQITKQVHDFGFTQQESTEIVDTLLEIIKARLENGGDVLVSGFGKFCVNDKPPRRARNPVTGDDLMLEGRRVDV